MSNTVKEYVTITIAVCISVLIALACAQGSLIVGEYPVLLFAYLLHSWRSGLFLYHLIILVQSVFMI